MLSNINSFAAFIEAIDKEIEKLSSNLDKYTIFFIFENEIYGSNEDNRLIFAKMKNQDKDLPSDWKEELGFQAEEIKSSLLNKNEVKKRIFYYKNISSIKIVDYEYVLKKLKNVRVSK